MLKEERQKLILEKLNTSQKINLGELESLLNVSYDSIRRDVIELEDKGLLKKVHGAVVANSYLSIIGGQRNGVSSSIELDKVIKKALKLILKNNIILMDGGTTNFFLAESIPKNLALTIITNSPPLAMVLNDHDNIEVILLGGKYFKRYQITMGQEVLDLIERFNIDLYFMGINGIHSENGLSIRNYEESLLKRKMITNSKRTVCCVIDEKIGVEESYKIGNVELLDTLITNLKPDDVKLKDFSMISLL